MVEGDRTRTWSRRRHGLVQPEPGGVERWGGQEDLELEGLECDPCEDSGLDGAGRLTPHTDCSPSPCFSPQ